tara:strand:- start:30 stop:440 length:411 start_codon:yes stop_codon:yes gene_type:complete
MSTVKTNTLTGTTTAGSIAVTGEGNSTTTNLQQGLAKAWVNIDGTGTVAANDSFNLSGLTDNGTGDYTRTVTSAFNATTYSTSSGGGLTSASVGTISQHVNDAPTTTAIRVQTANFAMSALADFDFIELNSFGDLA